MIDLEKKTLDGAPGILDGIKDFFYSALGITAVIIVVVATLIAPQIMIPVLIVYALYKLYESFTTDPNDPDKKKSQTQFWIIFILLLLALIIYFSKKNGGLKWLRLPASKG